MLGNQVPEPVCLDTICNFCGRLQLVEHIFLHGTNLVRCTQCDVKYIAATQVRIFVKPQDLELFCYGCFFKTFSYDSGMYYLLFCDNGYSCDGCNVTFRTLYALREDKPELKDFTKGRAHAKAHQEHKE